ncbi:thermostable alkaline protease [Fusarium heterosporum]|uniref:Thermostable alkaline protease n=1 Tax=Fusarium heterosporum TaxID=42747 RepID=A0A8H5TV56_FUSHE|nr:thermostable alkaline protease [Fusarium heterosporum]
MAPGKDGLGPCDLLIQASGQIYLVVLLSSIKQRERVSGEVATKLGQIAQESLLGYEIDIEIEKTAEALLQELLRICTFPDQVDDETTLNTILPKITELLKPAWGARLNKSISGYFQNTRFNPQVNRLCDEFLARLDQGRPAENIISEQAKTGTIIPEPMRYPLHVNENLYSLLRHHSVCLPLKSELNKDAGSNTNNACSHPVRIFLDPNTFIESKQAQFEVVVSKPGMEYWQDVGFRIPMEVQSTHRLVGFDTPQNGEENDDKDTSTSIYPPIDPDYFCQILERPVFAKLKVQYVHEVGLIPLPPPSPLERFLSAGQGLPLRNALQDYLLTDKDKILLAHTIAQSCWQYYGSDFMREQWTSHSVWFMFESDQTEEPHVHRSPKERLALRAYMSLCLNSEILLHEILDDPMSTHPFPHILGLGIMLLEIGLKRSFRRMDHLPATARLNWEHGAANQLLGELERGDYFRSTQKDIFIKVVASCLDPSIFTIVPKHGPKTTKRSKSSETTDKTPYRRGGEAQVDERRRRLYKHVVEPLARLVKVAFKHDPRYVSYLSRCKDHDLMGNSLLQLASFRAKPKTIITREWMHNLKHISAHIRLLQRQIPEKTFKPIKIAILDTGCDDSLAFFTQVNRKDCIGGRKDFVDCQMRDNPGETARDVYGHGSLMARIIMESAPLAHIYIARISKDPDELSSDKSHVAKAIRWAGLQESVDIISMSFGYPEDDQSIVEAIEDVARQRNIIFMASAGNNAKYQNETFPAKHRHVMSIRATNFAGSFSENNPPLFDDSISPAFGTFGGDLPGNIIHEISTRFGTDVCQPGSSIATAVAAGIAASTIAYADVLSCILRIPKAEDPVQCLKTTEGMRRMFKKMSPDQNGACRFVNPIWFWSEEVGAWKAWAAICNSVSKLMQQQR